MGYITIFSLPGCPHCQRARDGLEERKIPYVDINLSKHPGKLKDMLDLVHCRIVPQIFFNDVHIGSVDEVAALLKAWDVIDDDGGRHSREEEKGAGMIRHENAALRRYHAHVGSRSDPIDPRVVSPENARRMALYANIASYLGFASPNKENGKEQEQDQEEEEEKNRDILLSAMMMTRNTIMATTAMEKKIAVPDAPASAAKDFDRDARVKGGMNGAGKSRSADASAEGMPSLPPQPQTTTTKTTTKTLIRTPGPHGREVSIRALSDMLSMAIPRSDLRYLGKLYKDVFKGSDGVSALAKAFDLADRSEAVAFGRMLQKRHRLLDHVKSEHDFGDNSYFFRLLPFEYNSPGGEAVVGGGISLERLQHAASFLKSNVELKDRRFRLRIYPNCFVGRDAVTLLVTKEQATNRDEAVRMGMAMQSNLGLFEHVTGDHVFKDEELFYRFK